MWQNQGGCRASASMWDCCLVSCLEHGTGPRSQTTVCVVRLLPLGTRSQLGRQSGCGTGRVEPHVLLTTHQRAVPRACTQGLGS